MRTRPRPTLPKSQRGGSDSGQSLREKMRYAGRPSHEPYSMCYPLTTKQPDNSAAHVIVAKEQETTKIFSLREAEILLSKMHPADKRRNQLTTAITDLREAMKKDSTPVASKHDTGEILRGLLIDPDKLESQPSRNILEITL